MCNRMTQAQLDRIKAFARQAFEAALTNLVQAAYNAAPTELVPVVVARNGRYESEMMQWGVKPPGPTPLVTNARDDSLLNPEKRLFKDSAQKRRCAILADGFYEWQTIGRTKVPHYFFLKDHAPFAFAGLYEPAAEPDGPQRCMVVTTTPNPMLAVMHDRMPVILAERVRKTWLAPTPLTPENLPEFCRPYPVEEMEQHRTDSRMSSSRYKAADAIAPWQRDPGEFDFTA